MTPFTPLDRVSDEKCVSLIGIAGAGKTTLGKLLAERLGWVHLDTDRLIEATFGLPLQNLLDERGLKGFLAAEEAVVAGLGVRRTVIATGGSVVYSRPALDRLHRLGPVVHLDIELDTFLARVRNADERAFIRGPGLSLAEVYAQRQPLYRQACDFSIRTDTAEPKQCLEECTARLAPLLGRD